MDSVILGTEGQTICRPTTWKDVLKFFILNYGLHALTIVSAPGSKTLPTTIRAFAALLIPFSGTFTALDVIQRFARGQSGDLRTAHRAGALCMFVPTRLLNNSAEHVHRQLTEVHGQHRRLPHSDPNKFLSLCSDIKATVMAIYNGSRAGPDAAGADEHHPVLPQFDQILDPDVESTPVAEYSLIALPRSFTVSPLSETGFTSFTLSCDYSIPKAIVAIIQVVYGTTELYQSSLRQLPKFGYAAYSLTVIPYLLMSLVNLVAAACAPQYPTMFLVRYGGNSNIHQAVSSNAGGAQDNEATPELITFSDQSEDLVRGSVGEAYGNLQGDLSSCRRFIYDRRSQGLIIRVGVCALVGIPYLTIYVLTQFNGRASTSIQRGLTMAWLVIGQFYGLGFHRVATGNGMGDELMLLGFALVFGACAVGGFVVVGQMMLVDEVCTVI